MPTGVWSPEFGDGCWCERAGKEITLAHIALEVGKLTKLFTVSIASATPSCQVRVPWPSSADDFAKSRALRLICSTLAHLQKLQIDVLKIIGVLSSISIAVRVIAKSSGP